MSSFCSASFNNFQYHLQLKSNYWTCPTSKLKNFSPVHILTSSIVPWLLYYAILASLQFLRSHTTALNGILYPFFISLLYSDFMVSEKSSPVTSNKTATCFRNGLFRETKSLVGHIHTCTYIHISITKRWEFGLTQLVKKFIWCFSPVSGITFRS